MAVPLLVRFDRFATLTFGLIAEGNPGQIVANGLALTTRFVSGEIWERCCDPVETDWDECCPEPVTVWTEVNL